MAENVNKAQKGRPTNQAPQWRVQALSVPSPDSDLALYVAFDNVRYLFGVGEGVQRTFVQRKVSLKGVEGVFVLGGDGEGKRVGGLAGVFMTAADAGIKHLNVCGPPSITTQIASMRSFVMRDALAITTHTTDEFASHEVAEPVYTTSALNVKTITLRPNSSALQQAPESSPTQSSPIDWSSSTFRPNSLSPLQRRQWETTIINDMLRGPRPDSSASSFNASHPIELPELVPSNSSFRPNPARPNTRAALPLVNQLVQDTQLVYICEGPAVRGKFDAQKAKDLQVPNGPLRGQLTGGQAIEFEVKTVAADGTSTVEKRMVRPEDCMGEGEPGAIFVLASVPDVSYLPDLLNSPAWAPYRLPEGSKKPAQKVQLIVHRCSKAVIESPEWQQWLQGFGPQTHHLVAQTDEFSNRATFNSACWNMLSMSLLDDQIFSIPHTLDSDAEGPSLPPNTTVLQPYHNVGMYPAAAPQLLAPRPSDTPFPTSIAGLEEAKLKVRESMAEYAAAVDAAREAVRNQLAQRTPAKAGPGDNIIVTTLGTGSAIPSKYRNVSSTHLDIPGFGGVIFDAGEGTVGQLRRKYGHGLRKVYEDLKIIAISHMHADHHIGLAAVLEDRFKMGVDNEIVLIAPSFIKLHLQESHAWQRAAGPNAERVIFCDIFRVKLGTADATRGSDSDSEPEVKASAAVQPWGRRYHKTEDVMKKLESWGLVEVLMPEVKHRGKAYGCVLRHSDGWKVVYSGDTMPCDSLVDAGKDATLLIHEATLEDDKPEMALAKGHSTFGQAIDVGHRMNARHILLNHFSQRYPKLPRLQPSEPVADLAVAPVVSLSFDLMSLRVGDMWKMAHFKDAISLLFPAEDEAEGEMSETDEPAAVVAKKPAQPSGDPNSKNQQKKERARLKQQQVKEAKEAKEAEAALAHGQKRSSSEQDREDSKRSKVATEVTV